MLPYIHQLSNWPAFIWNDQRLITILGEVRHLQGQLIGKMDGLGFQLSEEASLETLTLEIINSNDIEGEVLSQQEVRSSLARRLGMEINGLIASDQHVDGVVDMVLDAVQKYDQPLTSDRLFGWHASLFPSGRSGMFNILVGEWRDDSKGPMQVVSGAIGKEKIHFEAPAAALLQGEMEKLLYWVNQENSLDPIIKAGIAHLWFITIHPFSDGNGRIARALTDMLLTRADGISQRFYSMSAQIRKERASYYKILEESQKATLDITAWLEWFLRCLFNAMTSAETILASVLYKHQFWTRHATTALNDRQIRILNKLLDGFEGNLTTGKYAKISKCSRDTALRDIQDLEGKKILIKGDAGGRSTNYELDS